jgi:hypothetical protein
MINPILQPFFQLVEYSTNFVITSVGETGFVFETKKPITMDYHRGEKARYTVMVEDLGNKCDQVGVVFENNGDYLAIKGFKDFIEYINPF